MFLITSKVRNKIIIFNNTIDLQNRENKLSLILNFICFFKIFIKNKNLYINNQKNHT
jgi:hypothetical protein